MIERFQKLDDQNFDYNANNSFVGFFVKGDKKLDHVGLIYVFSQNDQAGNAILTETRELHFMTNHLVIHKKLSPTKQYLHAPIGFDEITAKAFAGFLTAVGRKNGGKPPILYSLDWLGANESFDKHGTYLKEGTASGLTCATFVSELFRTFGQDPVDIGSWVRDDPDDLQWRTEKMKVYRDRVSMGSTSITTQQIDQMERISPLIRLRPEQIAGAIATDSELWPISHTDVLQMAEQVLESFNTHFSSPNETTNSSP